jgi:PAS domain S-box-containing protein
MLLGGALFLLHASRQRTVAQVASLIAGAIGFVALTGYVYGVQEMYGLAAFTRMAVHTSFAFCVLSVGVALGRPEEGLIAVLASRSAGGLTSRFLLPASVGALVGVHALLLTGRMLGLYTHAFGSALGVSASVIVLSIVVLVCAVRVDRSDADRRQTQDELERFFHLSHDMLCVANFDGYFQRVSPSWTATLGYSDAELRSLPYIERVHPEERESTLQAAARLSDAGESDSKSIRRRRCPLRNSAPASRTASSVPTTTSSGAARRCGRCTPSSSAPPLATSRSSYRGRAEPGRNSWPGPCTPRAGANAARSSR